MGTKSSLWIIYFVVWAKFISTLLRAGAIESQLEVSWKLGTVEKGQVNRSEGNRYNCKRLRHNGLEQHNDDSAITHRKWWRMIKDWFVCEENFQSISILCRLCVVFFSTHLTTFSVVLYSLCLGQSVPGTQCAEWSSFKYLYGARKKKES